MAATHRAHSLRVRKTDVEEEDSGSASSMGKATRKEEERFSLKKNLFKGNTTHKMIFHNKRQTWVRLILFLLFKFTTADKAC